MPASDVSERGETLRSCPCIAGAEQSVELAIAIQRWLDRWQVSSQRLLRYCGVLCSGLLVFMFIRLRLESPGCSAYTVSV
jgi:hypothetical protein